MPKNRNFIKFSNVFDSIRDKGIPSRRGLLRKFTSLKRKGAKLAYFVRDKFDKSFAGSTKVFDDEKTKIKDFKLLGKRPKKCLCKESEGQPNWRTRISEIGSSTRESLTKSQKPSATDQEKIQDRTQTSPSNKIENLSAIAEELDLTNDPELGSKRSSSILKKKRISLEAKPSGDEIESQTLPLLEERRKSSIKSKRTSSPLATESTERTDEAETRLSSLKVKEFEDSIVDPEIPINVPNGKLGIEADIHEVQVISEDTKINEVVERDEPIQYEIVNLSRQDLNKMKKDTRIQRIIRIDHKTLPPNNEDAFPVEQSDFHEEWKDVPTPVIDEIRLLSKPKRPHKCPKACACRFTQKLIDMYHKSKVLSSRAKEISEAREHCTLRMTSSEIDFFKTDTKMCNVMIGETQSRRAEMRELMDMWQEAKEKLSGRKKEMSSIVESIEQAGKRMNELENLVNEWLPGGRMEKLRKAHRSIEKEDQEKLEAWEDEERTFAKERIEEIFQNREARQEEERIREENRKHQRQQDTQTLQNATTLMQKYIDERKLLLAG